MGRYILVYSHPEKGEQRFELSNDRSYRIGSKGDNDVVLRQNDVSRHHAILRVRDGDFHLTDLNSKNGTFINGQRTASTSFQCGDMVNLSSARLVVVEVSSGAYAMLPELPTEALKSDRETTPFREDTLGYAGEASAEDMVSLLVATSTAVRRGAVAEPLNWAVERYGLQALVVLYRDDNDNVAMVSSAGDLGPLVRSSSTLARLAREQKGHRAGTKIQQVTELGENLLVAPMQRDNVLVVRFDGPPPAIGDIRAVIAAVEAVLCCGNPPCPVDGPAGDRRDPELRKFGNPLHRVAGLSESIGECKRRAAELARRDDPVLIIGEPGTGKSLFARAIHDLSRRRAQAFVALDCSELADDAVESSLFGRDGGNGRGGAVFHASGGSLYLKGLTKVPSDVQARILEMLLNGAGERLDCRMIASSSEPLESAVAAGRIMRDLASSLRGQRLDLPPLRQRVEDIPLLVTAFQRESAGQRPRVNGGFTVAALEALARYDWPENVRELRAEVLRVIAGIDHGALVAVSDLAAGITDRLAAQDAPPPDLGALASRSLADARAEFERWKILRALHDEGGNQTRAAERLGLSRAGLFKKMRKLGLSGRANSSG
jgi:transcriptional regulator with AAA-type ATPase domain